MRQEECSSNSNSYTYIQFASRVSCLHAILLLFDHNHNLVYLECIYDEEVVENALQFYLPTPSLASFIHIPEYFKSPLVATPCPHAWSFSSISPSYYHSHPSLSMSVFLAVWKKMRSVRSTYLGGVCLRPAACEHDTPSTMRTRCSHP